jgi:hypothetical protein
MTITQRSVEAAFGMVCEGNSDGMWGVLIKVLISIFIVVWRSDSTLIVFLRLWTVIYDNASTLRQAQDSA